MFILKVLNPQPVDHLLVIYHLLLIRSSLSTAQFLFQRHARLKPTLQAKLHLAKPLSDSCGENSSIWALNHWLHAMRTYLVYRNPDESFYITWIRSTISYLTSTKDFLWFFLFIILSFSCFFSQKKPKELASWASCKKFFTFSTCPSLANTLKDRVNRPQENRQKNRQTGLLVASRS